MPKSVRQRFLLLEVRRMSDEETKAASPKAEADAKAESDKDSDTKKTAKKAAAKDDSAGRSVGLHRE